MHARSAGARRGVDRRGDAARVRGVRRRRRAGRHVARDDQALAGPDRACVAECCWPRMIAEAGTP